MGIDRMMDEMGWMQGGMGLVSILVLAIVILGSPFSSNISYRASERAETNGGA